MRTGKVRREWLNGGDHPGVALSLGRNKNGQGFGKPTPFQRLAQTLIAHSSTES